MNTKGRKSQTKDEITNETALDFRMTTPKQCALDYQLPRVFFGNVSGRPVFGVISFS
jgi:hypothetical protein